jgi:hypothetical protein
VSAFLNTDGGRIIVGIEEKDGVASELSEGVSRRYYSWERLQQKICDRIQPAVAGYVSVYSVQVSQDSDGDNLFAFVVDACKSCSPPLGTLGLCGAAVGAINFAKSTPSRSWSGAVAERATRGEAGERDYRRWFGVDAVTTRKCPTRPRDGLDGPRVGGM